MLSGYVQGEVKASNLEFAQFPVYPSIRHTTNNESIAERRDGLADGEEEEELRSMSV
jgi:hypothetical protein